MQRKDFLLQSIITVPAIFVGVNAFGQIGSGRNFGPGGPVPAAKLSLAQQSLSAKQSSSADQLPSAEHTASATETLSASETPLFVVDAGKSRFGDVVKFAGVHPNDLKISSKDTDGQLSVFEYTGLSKVGPPLHLHYEQDEIFTILEGSYRFVCGKSEQVLNSGQTIFLPRNIPHTWLQLSEKGKILYMMQPAGKMEEFFVYMSNLKSRPTPEQVAAIHEAHGMKVVGPPLSL